VTIGEKTRLERERAWAQGVLETDERNWGWSTPAGRMRWRRRADFLAATDAGPGARVLELGMGSGTFTGELGAAFPGLLAIDVSPELARKARERFPAVRVALMDAHRLALGDASIDAVVGCSVLHHLDWERAFHEIARVLRPGGALRFSEPNLANPQIFVQKNVPLVKRWVGDSPDEYAFTAGQCRRALERAGFTSIRVRAFEFLHPSVPPALIPLVLKIETLLSRTFLRHLGGSLLIEARRPAAGAAPSGAPERHRAELEENRRLWERKPLLSRIYRGFYEEIARSLKPGGRTLEIGSGMGLIRRVIPECETSDLFETAGVARVENAYRLSLPDGSLRNVILLDVFHHLQYPGSVLAELHRVLEPGGRVLLLEPDVSALGLLVYGLLHHEGLGLRRPIEWSAPPGFRAEGAPYYTGQGNAHRLFVARREGADVPPGFRIVGVRRSAALSYVASGGFRGPQLYPSSLYPVVRVLDRILDLAPSLFSTRVLVVLEKRDE
jgi:ubiquinone/menaquinone biosynthesis C-methylase UbiE